MIAFDVQVLLQHAVSTVAPGLAVTAEQLALGPPKNPEFGDFTTPIALVLKKDLGGNPRDIAQKIADELKANPLFAKIDVAGPGHLNLTLGDSFWIRQLAEILSKRERFGQSTVGKNTPVLVEYVSANPTGPLHVGHARNAAVADTVANLLVASGHDVKREFYVNDMGAQMNNLGRSVWYRLAELAGKAAFPKLAIDADLRRILEPIVAAAPEKARAALALDLPALEIVQKPEKGFTEGPAAAKAIADAILANPEAKAFLADVQVKGDKVTAALAPTPKRRWERFGGLYYGDYVKELAQAFRQKHGDQVLEGAADEDGIPEPPAAAVAAARDFAHPIILDEQVKTLEAYGVKFDKFFSERSLHDSGAVQKAVDDLQQRGKLYEQDGALWFKSSESKEGGKPVDDKDRVLRKRDGAWTYITPDIAYHRDKLQRGFQILINAWGADHHGYIPRMKAALMALGFDASKFHVILIQMVKLVKGGVEVKMSKRSGSFVTLQEVIDEVGPDAARYLMLIRSSDSGLEFDLDLAKKQTNDNPVFYVQMGHARVCSIFKKAREEAPGIAPALDEPGLAALTSPMERDLIKRLARFPEEVAGAAEKREPHRMPSYLQDLVRTFHAYYSKKDASGKHEHKVVSPDPKRTAARLALCDAVRTVLGNGLRLCGVSAPEHMSAADKPEEGE